MKKNQPPSAKRYRLDESPLFGLENRRKLAELLRVDPSKLHSVEKSGLAGQYKVWPDKESGRLITQPVGDLAVVHERLLTLLTRIAPPAYLHSAVKKRSYKTNAEEHRSGAVLKIDIRKFYPSIRYNFVFSFFREVMMCSVDIATILSKLCTATTHRHGVHMPTGSCISPLLSYWVNCRLFDALHALCASKGAAFTLYIDDMTMSGVGASRALLTAVALRIKGFGYDYHKIKTYESVPAKVTGIMIVNGQLRLPHSRLRKIRETQLMLESVTGQDRTKLLASLVGRLSEAEQIDPQLRPQRERILQKYRDEWSAVVAARAQKAAAATRRKQQRASDNAAAKKTSPAVVSG